MYGTIAKMRVKPGKEKELERVASGENQATDGFIFAHAYRMDDDPQTVMLAVAFDSRESYRANAESPRQHEGYLAYRALLEEEPEWHDGEIIFSDIRQESAAASD
jgi:heme-degrading monooxygenase HmoA